jgi:hypothetical protein
LRAGRVWLALGRALSQASNGSFRVLHYSVQTDHVHLIVEADAHERLAIGDAGARDPDREGDQSRVAQERPRVDR